MMLLVLLATNAVEGALAPGGSMGGAGNERPNPFGRKLGFGGNSQDEAGSDGGEALSNADQVEAGNDPLDAPNGGEGPMDALNGYEAPKNNAEGEGLAKKELRWYGKDDAISIK